MAWVICITALVAGCDDDAAGTMNHDAGRPDAGQPGGDDGGLDASVDGSAPEPDAAEPEPDAAVQPASGAIQKGPFVLGSTVTVSEIDTSGAPTGVAFNLMTEDDLGRFPIDTLPVMDAAIAATGYYFNEVLGRLSSGTLTLRGLHHFDAEQSPVTVNAITHLTYNRALALLDAETSLAEAQSLAEAELRATLGIRAPESTTTADGWSLLGGDNDDNAYLLALSVLLGQVAKDTAASPDTIDGTLAQLLNGIADDLADDGEVSSTTRDLLVAAQCEVLVDEVVRRLRVHVASLAAAESIPDMNRILDADGDGLVNRDDNCPLVANPTQDEVAGKLCSLRRTAATIGPTGVNLALVQNLAIGDFDEDGHQDLEPLALENPGYGILLGDGSGGFTAQPSTVDLPDYANKWLAQDANQDGHLDLVVFGAEGQASASGYYPGDGHGGFGSLVVIDQAFDGALADLDVDGALDAVLGSEVISSDGHGAFAGAADVTGLETLTGEIWSIDVADMDGMNEVDVVIGLTDAVAVFLNDGMGSLAEVGSSISGNGFEQPFFGDVDGDSHLDVVSAGQGANGWNALVGFGDGAGHLGDQVSAFPGYGGAAHGLCAGDFRGAGRLDMLAMLREGSAPYQLLFVPGSTTPFAAPQEVPFPQFQSELGYLASADLNDDGVSDFVLSDYDAVTRQNLLWIVIVE